MVEPGESLILSLVASLISRLLTDFELLPFLLVLPITDLGGLLNRPGGALLSCFLLQVNEEVLFFFFFFMF